MSICRISDKPDATITNSFALDKTTNKRPPSRSITGHIQVTSILITQAPNECVDPSHLKRNGSRFRAIEPILIPCAIPEIDFRLGRDRDLIRGGPDKDSE